MVRPRLSQPAPSPASSERGRPPERWGSALSFVLAVAGSAVGLGNLWGFAYRASQGGGAAFVLLYVLIVVLVCLPVLVAEMVLGRSTGQVVSMGLTGLVVAAGIRAGIERLTSWGMPLLFLLLLALAIWASFLPGAQEGYQGFLLRWDPSKLIDLTTIRNAFTQAFFSIGAGIGCILVYAVYLDQRSALPREAVSVVGLDTAVGLMAGCVTFPVVASFGLGDVVTGSTVGALFIALPTGLASLGGAGRLVAVLFFALAYIAAITSSVSLLEVPVSSLMDRLGWSRRRTTWLCVLAITLLGLPAALDVGVLERMDALFGGVLLIAAGLAMAVLLGWVAPQRLQADLAGCGSSPRLQRLLLLALRWISPLAIAVGLAVSVTDLVRTWAG